MASQSTASSTVIVRTNANEAVTMLLNGAVQDRVTSCRGDEHSVRARIRKRESMAPGRDGAGQSTGITQEVCPSGAPADVDSMHPLAGVPFCTHH